MTFHKQLIQSTKRFSKDAAADIRLIRRMDRDCAERGRTVAQVLEQYHQTVRPMHVQYVEPSKQIADIIVHSTETSDPEAPHSFDVACKVLTNHLMVVSNLIQAKTPTTMDEAIAQMKIEPPV
jgi:uridine kinase